MFRIWYGFTGIAFLVATILSLAFYGKESRTAKIIQSVAPALAVSFGMCNVFVALIHVAYGF